MARISSVAVAAAFALLAGCQVWAQTTSTLQDPKNAGTCLQKYNRIMTTLYADLPDCADIITKALNTTVPSQCPEKAPIQRLSKTHLCMNKNGTGPAADAAISAWTDFVRTCEVMYVANRGGNGESEEGFVAYDNSCFQRFNSFSDFTSWLTNVSPVSSTTASGTAVQASVSILMGAVLSVLLFMVAL